MNTTDIAARRAALTLLDRSLLVEAGAGSGKTSLLAGRIVASLASGTSPASIAAVSFTEMAAAELMMRVNSFIERTVAGDVPKDIAAAFDGIPSEAQMANLRAAKAVLGELTCTTIHGFCKRLIQPFPVEADMDPGAQVLDPVEAGMVFDDIFEKWLRSELSGHDPAASVIASIVTHEPKSGVALIRSISDILRNNPFLTVPAMELDDAEIEDFTSLVAGFERWYASCGYVVAEHEPYLAALKEIAASMRPQGRPHLVAIALSMSLSSSYLVTSKGSFRSYRLKGKYESCAPARSAGGEDFLSASAHYERCCEKLDALRRRAAGAALHLLHREVRPVVDAYASFKKNAACLDFSDLLVSAHRLLESYPEIRAALSAQFTHILVDEFQDTDPLQTQIFLHLAFDRTAGGWIPRPGAIFLVGDPKQAIYRFRGADVATYVLMRETIRAYDPEAVLSVSTNFRSVGGILGYVNAVFEDLFNADGQPGFARLSASRTEAPEVPVAYLEIDDMTPPEDGGKLKVGHVRDREAEAVADACTRLIGSYEVWDPRKGVLRPCRAGDIALLVPQGTELWRYENALERSGVAVATQAGKGLFKQQEIQDLTALTRAVADPRDTLALGALLRGPLVGLTEQELLDESARLPEREDGSMQFLRVGMDVLPLANPILVEAMTVLGTLRERADSTTPHALLCAALDAFKVKPKIVARFGGNPERRLSNVDRYLELSRPYSVRGIRAFSDAMRAAWEDADRIEEGRPDESENAISLITMHSAKGLEWPVVIPVNTVTQPIPQGSVVVDARNGLLTMPFFELLPENYDEAKQRAENELALERLRIWYVATTRARDLLVLPRLSQRWSGSWASLIDMRADLQAALSVADLPREMPEVRTVEAAAPDRATFESQRARVAAASVPIVWRTPSRHEWVPFGHEILSEDDLVAATPDPDPYATVTGGPERGNVLHKMMEEILNGECPSDERSVRARVEELVGQYRAFGGKAAESLIPDELARCVLRTLALPIVSERAASLLPEMVSSSAFMTEEGETVDYGVSDAVHVVEDGTIKAVFDWKSDLRPNAESRRAYARQVGRYIDMIEVEKGYVVFMSTGEVLEVRNEKASA